MGDNIIGKSFEEFVINQIDYRQEILSSTTRDQKFLKYVSKTPWLRMASSVNISSSIKASELGLGDEYMDSKAAEQFVLQGGLTGVTEIPNEDESISYSPLNLRYGVSPNNSIVQSKDPQPSYGFGTSTQGKTPMPGLTSVSVQNYNNGAIRKGVVRFTCTSLEQFNIINTLYMRVGYYTLVEWGHTAYLDARTKTLVNRQEFSTPAIESFFQGKNSSEILKNIQEEVSSSSGNYDAFIGRITNFNWTFNDGSYDCSVDIYSPGDVIDSLKVNTTFSQPVEVISKNLTQDQDMDALRGSSVNPEYGVDAVVVSGQIEKIKPLFIRNKDTSVIASTLYEYFSELNQKKSYFTTNSEVAEVEIFRFTDGSQTKSYFITLGKLLEVIQNKTLLYDKTSKEPIIRINSDYNSNFCARFPEQVSTDWNKCYIPYTLSSADGKDTIISQKLTEATKDSTKRYDYKNYVGKMMHILVNFDFIITTLNSSLDKNNKLSLKGFLQTLMNGISSSIGGINEFKVGYSSLTNELTIYDNNPLVTSQLVNSEKPKVAKFNSYGVKKDISASFLLNISIQSSISNDMATMIAVGAQSSGNQIGENATAFSLFNEGLIDRVQPTSLDAYHANTKSTEAKDPAIVFKENKQKLFDLVRLRSTKGASEKDLNAAKSINTDYAKYYLGRATEVEKTPGNIFIPFNMTLEMDGLSGIRIFDIFTVDNKILPEMYTNSLNFVIKGVQHDITVGGWTTTVNSLTYNQFEATDPKPLSNIKTYKESNSNSNATLSGRYFNPDANNPYNIRPIGTAKKFNGVIGDKEGFQGDKPIGLFLVFDELDNGIRAGMKNLVNGYFKRGINTVDKIINRYAPSSDGNNTNSYINNVVNYINTYIALNFKASNTTIVTSNGVIKTATKGTELLVTKDTILTFSGFDEPNPDNKLIFKALNLAILSSEGSINQIPNLVSAVEKFSISKLKSTA